MASAKGRFALHEISFIAGLALPVGSIGVLVKHAAPSRKACRSIRVQHYRGGIASIVWFAAMIAAPIGEIHLLHGAGVVTDNIHPGQFLLHQTVLDEGLDGKVEAVAVAGANSLSDQGASAMNCSRNSGPTS